MEQKKEGDMEQQRKEDCVSHHKHYHNSGAGAGIGGVFWMAGWLFTIAYVNLVWWKMILALVVWPYYLGAWVR